jgi:hypothetical protein
MKIRIAIALLFILSGILVQGKNLLQKFDKSVFYAAMASGNVQEIDNEIDIIKYAPASEKEGYEGALLMRKAGLMAIPAQKLKLFKAGRIKLETALLNDSSNAEFHFLRFAIQEHAPKIVKYRNELETDKQFIQKSFKSLPPVVQHAIIDYTKNSKILHAQDF